VNTVTRSRVDVATRVGIAGLAVTNGYIHSQLGGLMFTMNAVGWVVLAAALLAPVWPAPQLRFLTRLGVAGFAATTAIGWLLFGARYDMGYVSFGLDVVIAVVALADSLFVDGSPIAIAKKVVRFGTRFVPGAAHA